LIKQILGPQSNFSHDSLPSPRENCRHDLRIALARKVAAAISARYFLSVHRRPSPAAGHAQRFQSLLQMQEHAAPVHVLARISYSSKYALAIWHVAA
jgi:hypothetical protein